MILIPLNAIIQDPRNPFGLDDSEPITALNEDFNAKALLPKGWGNVAVEGARTWMMRTTGGVNANRYPAIDALGDAEGRVHALLVLPPLNFDDAKLKASYLIFDVAALKANGAQLRLVQVAREGSITPLLDLTAQQDHEWAQKSYPLTQLKGSGMQFLAFEYIGQAGSASTVYRVDNVRIAETLGAQEALHEKTHIATAQGRILLSELPQGCSVALYTLEGVLLKNTTTTQSDLCFDALSQGVYLLKIASECYKVLVP